MSARGVFAVDRGIWCDPDFADEAFSEREAFLWLVSEAAWRPTRVRIGSALVDLARGQCAFSTRFMAAKWKWSEARVRRYLGRLISAEILCTTTDKNATHITILKYDRFQRVSLPDADEATHQRRTRDAPPTHQRRKEEDKEYREDITSEPKGSSVSRGKRARPKTKITFDAQPNERQKADAAERGLPEAEFRLEWQRFRDRCLKTDAAYSDWEAAWRNWLDSPFRQSEAARSRASPAGRESKTSHGALSLLRRVKEVSDVPSQSNGYDHHGPVIDHEGNGRPRGQVLEQVGGQAGGFPSQAVVEFARTRWG